MPPPEALYEERERERETLSTGRIQDNRKGGLSLRGGGGPSVLAVWRVFGGSGEDLALLLLVLHKVQCQESTVAVLTVLAVVAVPVVTATPLKLNPPFP